MLKVRGRHTPSDQVHAVGVDVVVGRDSDGARKREKGGSESEHGSGWDV